MTTTPDPYGLRRRKIPVFTDTESGSQRLITEDEATALVLGILKRLQRRMSSKSVRLLQLIKRNYKTRGGSGALLQRASTWQAAALLLMEEMEVLENGRRNKGR